MSETASTNDNPTAPVAPPAPAAPPNATNGIAIAALVVGIVAFLMGLVPGLGPLLAIAGIVLAILAFVKRAQPVWMPLVGVIGSGIALLAGGIALAVTLAIGSAAGSIGTAPVLTPAAPDTSVVDDESEESEPEPAVVEDPEPVAEPETSLTLAQEQAVLKAQSYLSTIGGFSRKGLIEQLEFEGFEKADAKFAVDYLDVDWNEQAAIKAASYMQLGGFSKKGLIEQLEFEGFTSKQAAYGAKSVGF